MWNEKSLWPYETETIKQLDTPKYRSEPIPVNPVIRNSNHEQPHIIPSVENGAQLCGTLVGRLKIS